MSAKYIVLLIMSFFVAQVQAQIDRSKLPDSGPAPEISLGYPATFKLDNGLKVLVVENHKLPRVNVSLSIDNRPYSQGKQVGVKALYAAMMGNGTANIDKDKFNERIDFLGAKLSYGEESTQAKSLTKYFPEVFKLMVDGLLNPLFSETEFETQKQRLIEEVKARENSASAIAQNVDKALVYGKDHPYGEFMTTESLNRVSLSDVKSYFNNFISPKHAYLVVVGDVKFDDVKALVEDELNQWKEETPPSASLPKVRDVQYTQINFVNVPNAVQSEIAVMNTVELKKSDPDYFAAIIANQILGGGADGRLFNNLREDKAYTYGAYSNLGNDKYIAMFKASASVRNAVTDSAVIAFLDEIHKIQDTKVSRQELELAKAKFTGDFVRALENPMTIARYALNTEKYNLPKDYYQNFVKNINAVTAEDIERVAHKYFKSNNARVVIVGNGKEVLPKLEKLEYNNKSVPVKYFDKDANPIDKPEYELPASAGVTVDSIYGKYLDAVGGKKAVHQIKSIYIKYKGQISGQTITMVTKQTNKDQLFLEIRIGTMVMQKVVYNGENGYLEAQGQKQSLTDENLEKYRRQAGLFPELRGSKNAKVSGKEKIDGEETYVVEADGQSIYYSVKTGLKLKISAKTEMGISTALFSDYKMAEGVRIPYTVSRSFGPQSVEFHIEGIMINEGVSQDDFE